MCHSLLSNIDSMSLLGQQIVSSPHSGAPWIQRQPEQKFFQKRTDWDSHSTVVPRAVPPKLENIMSEHLHVEEIQSWCSLWL